MSKKSESSNVKRRRIAATSETLSRVNAPNRSNCPVKSNFGTATISVGTAGIPSCHPPSTMVGGFPGVKLGLMLNACWIPIAKAVAEAIPIRIAPLTLRTISAMMRSVPKTNTTVGQPTRLPFTPRPTGTGPAAVRRTKPASTNPIRAMNRPIPTEIAILICAGTALNTATRNPVSTSTKMIRPSRTTRPIAAAHVICDAIPTATNVLSPRPVANARG